MEDFNRKKDNIDYTMAIIKPDVAQFDDKVQEILAKIEAAGFHMLHVLKKELTKQEVINLYYKHIDKDYFDNMAKFLMNGESVILLLTAGEDEDPISKWKAFIGHSDPVEAKKTNPQSLRAIYGTNIMKNGFHGSDDIRDVDKERDIFKLPIPQRVPEFKFEKFRITLDMLLKFIYPPNLEHPNVNSRLDVFAVYGPVVNQHSVDTCFCRPCAQLGKEYLQRVIADKIDEKKKKLGITKKAGIATKGLTSLPTTGNAKLQVSPLRLVDEKGIIELWPQLCEKCRTHCETTVHLTCGREGQHIMNEHEIDGLSKEINKEELHKLLKKEKGSTADVMIEYLEIKEPDETQYNRKLIKHLFKTLDNDYYERYNFLEMQNVILEDRRIRMNAWVAKIIGKPLDRFVNPKLLEADISEDERKDPKSVNYVINRIEPLSYTVKPKNINEVSTGFAESIVDKKKLRPNEEKIVLFKLLHRNSHHIVGIDQVNSGTAFVNSVYIMRDNYNEGRHGSWNNYSSLKGMNKGTYVKTEKNMKNTGVF